MPTLLALTVGGSCAPIVTAIQSYTPDYVCFLASAGPRGSRASVDGPGDPCGDPRKGKCPACGHVYFLGETRGASIVAQTELAVERYQVTLLQEPDAFRECYITIWETLSGLRGAHPHWRLIADYTGGTKTMTAALAAAALDLGWELSLIQGTRTDLVKVRNGTEVAALVNSADVRAHQAMTTVQRLFDAYAYASAAELLQAQLRAAPLSPDLQREIRAWVALCRAFDAWDHFDHALARTLLEPHKARCTEPWKALFRLTGPNPGYLAVIDLLRNAERRAARGRYDDATARLYRALEMLAQMRMGARSPALDSSRLNLADLPKSLRAAYAPMASDDGVIHLGLRQDYELLQALDDPLGQVYGAHAPRLLQALGHRNASILAHGTVPVTAQAWREMHTTAVAFIDAGLEALQASCTLPQFPHAQEIAPC